MIGALESDGFIVIEGLLDPPTVASISAALEPLARGGPASALDRDGTVYGARNLLTGFAEVRALAGSPAVRRLVGSVLGPRAFPVRGLFFDKTPGANWMVPWHQDLTIAVAGRRDVPGFRAWTKKAGVDHVQPPVTVLERMLTVRLHLDDCGPGQGPLRVAPGSHRGGRLDAVAVRDWLGRAPAHTCLVRAGGAVVMRPLLLHASSAAESPSRRRVIHLEFAADPLPGGLTWYDQPTDLRPTPLSGPTP